MEISGTPYTNILSYQRARAHSIPASETRGPSRSPVPSASPAADRFPHGIPGVFMAGSTNSQWLCHSKNNSGRAGSLRERPAPRHTCAPQGRAGARAGERPRGCHLSRCPGVKNRDFGGGDHTRGALTPAAAFHVRSVHRTARPARGLRRLTRRPLFLYRSFRSFMPRDVAAVTSSPLKW